MGQSPVASVTAPQRDLVLVGAGHAHVQVLRRFMMTPESGVRITLVVDRYEAVYSGMVPGFVAGDYRRDELGIDALPLARRAGARCILAPALGIDPVERRVLLDGRPSIRYDVASLDVGSTVRDLDLPGVAEHALATRPIGRFVEALDRRLRDGSVGRSPRVVVVGGGAAGVELALCLEARLRGEGRAPAVTLVSAAPVLLDGDRAALGRRAAAELRRRGIDLRLDARVAAVESSAVGIASGAGRCERQPSDVTVWATGAAPPAWLAASKLPVDEAGYVRTDANLAVPGCDGLFAAGDCAVQDGARFTPRAGVYAVRQGPVLAHNLRARLRARPLRRYRAQRDFLALLNVGGGRALGGKWGIAVGGRAVFRGKDWIDRRFVRRFRVLEPDGVPSPGFPDPESMPGADAMTCGGCAAKVGATPLAAALGRLPPPIADDSVRVGLDRADDAALLTLGGGAPSLASVDAFRAFTDDPWLIGRVAAVNAVNDVYAKGGRPRHALALVTVPDTEVAGQEETLFQVLAGLRAALDPLGVSLVGGHSTTGPELFVGLSVTGELEPGQVPFGQDGLRPGDRLVLTRPLGSGVLLAADARGLARGEWIEALLGDVTRPSATAAVIARRAGVVCCTDVSGFGLAGHLLDLVDASRVDVALDVDALPLHRGVHDLLARGVRSTFHAQNRSLGARLHFDVASASSSPPTSHGAAYEISDVVDGSPRIEALFDPQTAGGLLIGVSASAATDLLAQLHEAGDIGARAIGTVLGVATGAPSVVVRAERAQSPAASGSRWADR